MARRQVWGLLFVVVLGSPPAFALDTIPDQAGDWTEVGQLDIELGASGSWDDGWISMQDVVKRGDTFYLYYTGGTTQDCAWGSGYNNHTSAGVATSTDGVNFTKYAGNPIATAVDFGEDGIESEEGIRSFNVTYDSLRDKFLMYAGQEHANASTDTCDWAVDAHLNLATSSDGFSFVSDGLVDCEHNNTYGMEFYPSQAVYVPALDEIFMWTHCAECTDPFADHTEFANSASGSDPMSFGYLGEVDTSEFLVGDPFVHDDNNTVTMISFDKPALETYLVTTSLDEPTQLSDKRLLFTEYKENGHSLLKDTEQNKWMWYYNDKPYADFSGYRFYLRTAVLSEEAPCSTETSIDSPQDGVALQAGETVTATGSGCNLVWSIDRIGDGEEAFQTGSGSSVSFTVPVDATSDQSIVISLSGDLQSDSQTHGICSETSGCCVTDCDDADPCTTDSCEGDACVYTDNGTCDSDSGLASDSGTGPSIEGGCSCAGMPNPSVPPALWVALLGIPWLRRRQPQV